MMGVTVSPVIPGVPTQATAKTRPSADPDDLLKTFANYLRLSAQDDGAGAPNSGISEPIAKTGKNEKQTTKKADADQPINAIGVLAPPSTEQPPPPLSITALLGLPTAPKTDTAETGKAADSEGKAVLSTSAIGSDQQLSASGVVGFSKATADALKSDPPAFLKPQPKIEKLQAKIEKPQAADTIAYPAAPAALPNESREIPSANSPSVPTSSVVNGNNVELLTASPPSAEAAPTVTPGNLAFALRLSETPVNSTSQQRELQAPAAESIASAAPVASVDLTAAVQAAAGPQLKEQSQEHDGNAGTAFYEVPQMHQGNISDAPQPSSEQGAQATAALPAHQEIANSEPVRNVHMQVIGDNNNRVDVRLIDRGGELHVSVKSGDINLAQNLQDHMPELTSRLEQQRFQAEVWIPKLADNSKAEMSGSRDFSSGGNNNSHSSNTSDQQGKRQQYQPDWVDVLENSTQGTGKIDQTWLQ